MNKSSTIKSVILDLDQTLTEGQSSWIQFTNLLGADVVDHIKIYEDFKAGIISYDDSKRRLMSVWRKVSDLHKKNIEDIFDKILLRKGVVEGVDYLKSKYNLCIISGAIDLFVEKISARLGIKDWYSSTKFLFDSKGYLHDFHYKSNDGFEKLKYLNNYCSRYGISPSNCAAIGDGASDMPIFERVGLPILFEAYEMSDIQSVKIRVSIKDWSEINSVL